MKYLANTFSPLMISEGKFSGVPISLSQAKALSVDAKSVVGHEVTAPILSALLGLPVAFNRENLSVIPGDQIVCVIPKFRADKAREFSHEEVAAAGFQAFLVDVAPAPKLAEEEAGKPVEWTWNDGMGSRSRHPQGVPMKIFLISQDENNDYDTFDSAVVVAEDENEARNIRPGGGDWGESFSTWCSSPELVKVEYIGEASEKYNEGVVCASFNAG